MHNAPFFSSTALPSTGRKGEKDISFFIFLLLLLNHHQPPFGLGLADCMPGDHLLEKGPHHCRWKCLPYWLMPMEPSNNNKKKRKPFTGQRFRFWATESHYRNIYSPFIFIAKPSSPYKNRTACLNGRKKVLGFLTRRAWEGKGRLCPMDWLAIYDAKHGHVPDVFESAKP